MSPLPLIVTKIAASRRNAASCQGLRFVAGERREGCLDLATVAPNAPDMWRQTADIVSFTVSRILQIPGKSITL
jgi:hypothetical protein